MDKNYFDEEELERKFPDLYGWFGYFLGKADIGEFDIDIIINKNFRYNYVYREKQTVAEAEEVLKLEQFPEDLIGDITNTYSPIETRKEWLQGFKEKLQAKIDEVEGNTNPNKLESNKTISKDNNVLKFPGVNIRSDE